MPQLESGLNKKYINSAGAHLAWNARSDLQEIDAADKNFWISSASLDVSDGSSFNASDVCCYVLLHQMSLFATAQVRTPNVNGCKIVVADVFIGPMRHLHIALVSVLNHDYSSRYLPWEPCNKCTRKSPLQLLYDMLIILGGRRFLPQAPRSYPIPMAHRVTPGKPEVTPGTKSYWHTGTTPSLVWQTK